MLFGHLAEELVQMVLHQFVQHHHVVPHKQLDLHDHFQQLMELQSLVV